MAAGGRKVCSVCKEEKPFEHFFNDKIKSDGKASTCKICSNRRQKKWKEENSFPSKTTGTKKCRECRVIKEITEFYRNNKAKDGRTSVCSTCAKIRSEQWTKDYKYTKVRSHRYKYRYGISLEEYEDLLNKQNHKCANLKCDGKAEDQFYGTLSVDHDHSCCESRSKTCGLCIRGLLCDKCNKALGLMKDNVEKMNGLIDYLEGYKVTS